MNFLAHLFSFVCGQVHTWAPGGQPLPFCERCTGLYVGAIFSIMAILLFRPRPTRGSLWAHGATLLLMIPFGFHLLPQGPIIRTVTGQLFSVGLTYFLVLTPLGLTKSDAAVVQPTKSYVALVSAGILLVLLSIRLGGLTTATVLAWLGFAGLTIYAALSLLNLIAIPAAIWVVASHKQRPVT